VIDVSQAISFIRQQGTPIERTRLDYLRHGKSPSSAIGEELFSGQRPDGGWTPFWKPKYSSLDATCFRLAQAEQLGLMAANPVTRVLPFLLGRQRADGSWQEDRSVAEAAPPWAKPDDLAATLYLTANCGYWVSRLSGDPPAAIQAARFLLEHADDSGRMPTFAHGHWLATGLWHRAGYRQATERTMGYLDTILASLPASNLSWLILTLAGAGIAPAHPLLERAAARLVEEQQDDGHWVNEDGSQQDVHATLEALRALRLHEGVGMTIVARTPARLEGSRIVLRDWEARDLEPLAAWLAPGHRWRTTDAPYFSDMTGDQIDAYVVGIRDRIRTGGLPVPRHSLVIAERDAGNLIGMVSWYWESQETNWPGVAIVIYDPECWGQGLGYKALGLWTDYLFRMLPEIVRVDLRTWSGNGAMMRLAEKLGYVEEARFRQARIVDDAYYDGMGYGVLREEWEARYPPGFATALRSED